ncbi:malonic semialdehyde reductase [Comamonas sp. J-3]|uniref:malonic semialdehyde reductase n=1 Tax=Comamonas trifloxystrobinivorans TaxID=3350256 RepID=UPI00372C3A72
MLDQQALDTLFRQARSHNGWLDRPVTDEQLRAIYELCRWGPSSGNSCPMRLIFVRTGEARERLLPWLAQGNIDKVRQAPVTAILGYDQQFYRALPRLFAHNPEFGKRFEDPQNAEHTQETAFRNASLQAAYLMLAARGLGLDCGPLSGFDAAGVDATFWAGTTVRTNFLCCLGYGDSSKLFARLPRLEFDEVCQLQ